MDNTTQKLVLTAIDIIWETQNPSLSLLRVKLKLSLDEATDIMDTLVSMGFISDYRYSPAKILLSKTELHNKIITKNQSAIHTFSYDTLDGLGFEHFCSDLLKYNGFSNIMVTSGSGDFGVDILCHKEQDMYAIQCKCYSHPVGNKAVQEVVSGKIFYRCTKAVVMTNNYFTAAAEETARLTDVELWNRHCINELLHIASQNGFVPHR